jgi:hypothetical protein
MRRAFLRCIGRCRLAKKVEDRVFEVIQGTPPALRSGVTDAGAA